MNLRALSHWGTPDAQDRRLAAGYARQRDTLDQLKARGVLRVGRKIGANDPATQRRLGLSGPLLGFLTQNTLRTAEFPIPISTATLAGVEGEVAFHIANDVPPTASNTEIERAIGGVSLVAEIIDIDRRFDDVSDVLEANIFHRNWSLGQLASGVSLESLQGTLLAIARNDRTLWTLPIGFALGSPIDAVRFVAAEAARQHDILSSGEIVISGLLTPLPVWVTSGDRVKLDAGKLGTLELAFTV